MRRQVFYWNPLPVQKIAGEIVQGYGDKTQAFLSVQPVDGGSSFRAYLTGKRPQDYQELIGEAELDVSDDGQHNGAIIAINGKYFEIVQRLDWLNGVNSHYEYLAFSMPTETAMERLGL